VTRFSGALTPLLAAVLAAAAAWAQPVPETPSPVAIPDTAPAPADAAVTEAVQRRLEPFEALEGVSVATDGGTVRLGGEVATVQAWRQAQELARGTDGVAAVVNDIEISGDVLGQVDALGRTLGRAANFAPVVVFALAVLALFVLLSWLVGRWSAPFERLSPNRFIQEVTRTAVQWALVLAGIVLALHVVDATAIAGALVGTAGVAGIAIGFAFKDLVENYLASVLLSLRQPFAPNDHVDIDGFEGKVVRLTSRATLLMTLDGNHVRIPNARVFKGVIVNYTRNPRRRFELTISVSGDSDLATAQDIGVDVLRRMPGVLDDPPPWAMIADIGDSSVPLTFYGWVDQQATSFALARSEAIRLVKDALEGAGIELPEPIFRVRTERAERGFGDRPHPPDGIELRTDISERGDPIVGQIDEERQAGDVADLLDPGAPRE